MVFNENMAEMLAHLIQRLPDLADFLRDEHYEEAILCQQLVVHYRETEDLVTRKLIMEFMQEAGYSWLRKLFIRGYEPFGVAA
jgi:hypothetical protein